MACLSFGQDENLVRSPTPVRITQIFPQPNDSICSVTPRFSWSAPAIQAGTHFRFELYDAPQNATYTFSQLPLWEGQTNRSTYYPQPGVLPLEKGKRYAWRVISIQNGQPTGISDARLFYYGCPTLEKEAPVTTSNIPYCRMGSTQAPPTYPINDQTLAFYFTQQYPNDTLRLHVYNDAGNLLSQKTLQTKPGNNYMRFSMTDLGLDAESNVPLSLVLTASFQEPLALRLERR